MEPTTSPLIARRPAPPALAGAARAVAGLLALSVLSLAAAQLPLNAPTYYLSQLPELSDGTVLDGELTADDGQNYKDGSYLDVYVMYGVAGEQVRVAARSADFDTYLTVFDPSGSFLDANDDDWDGYGSDSVLNLTLPETGRYLVVVSGYSQFDMGAYQVERGAAPPISVDATPIAVPSVVQGALDASMPPAPGTWGGPSQVYAIELSEAAMLSVSLSSPDYDTMLYVMDEAGTILAENDDSGSTTDSQVLVELEAGRYLVVASAWSSDAVGSFTLDLKLYVPAN